MIQKRDFLRLIGDCSFKELFVTELGWNRYRAQSELPTIAIDDIQYNITAIAERNGFQILTCNVDELPSNSACRKIDTKLRKQANDYICIFTEGSTVHHLWVVPVKNNEKRDLTFVEYNNTDQADLLYSKVDGFSFELGEETNIVDVRAKVHKAFIVNNDKITKDFYTGFRKQHKAFTGFITGIDDNIEIKKNRKKQWYTSVMLNRLMFCYFIQKKGFLNGDFDYLRHKLEWVKQEQGEDRFFHSFYKGFLVQLFHDGLNAPRHTPEWERTYGKIPYLNGGMFDIHELEQEYADIDISDEAFEQLFRFFDGWRWHLDTRITASGKDINPDVLGYIFEQYINDRAAMGAYYTKEDITEYIGKNCILPFLIDGLAESDPNAFKADGEVWTMLRESGDRYIYDAIKRGYSPDWQSQIPEEIAIGIDTSKENLLERRSQWNTPTPDRWALPTEIWRETIERLQRCDMLLGKIAGGEITTINDFITYNLDIRSFVYDLLHNTEDNHLVLHFYHALQNVTILDPTCGSGAFLFAAMNILEPLYEVCIERMQEWNEQNPALFKTELAEITNKYRSNIQYFIFKSIILRNLYGVDIMVEATEIAKLRLFLKMVAVVEVDRRADNMGLDPLPDIDFNIRSGNTLVGYATEEQLIKDLSFASDIMQVMANQEFKAKIDEEMARVATTYNVFKRLQLTQDTDLAAFKKAKAELRNRLTNLNDLLNKRLFSATQSDNRSREDIDTSDIFSSAIYNDWIRSHQPFHWLAEFYQIMHDNGGFDVIIGNPPYVEYNRRNRVTGLSISDIYQLNNYETINCNNLYAFVIERSCILSSGRDNIGFIVPLTLASNNNMRDLRDYICKTGISWYSHYEIRPGKLFEGAEQRVTIFFIRKSDCPKVYSTSIQRWHAENRVSLFKLLRYSNSFNKGNIWRISTPIENSIFEKFDTNKATSLQLKLSGSSLNYRTAGVRYWIIFLNHGFGTQSLSNKTAYFENDEIACYYMAAFNSNLFWWYYAVNFDMFNLKDYMIFNFKLDYDKTTSLSSLAQSLENDMDNNKIEQVINSKTRGIVTTSYYQKKQSKPIIDEIDKVLAKHYGFTDEELDFIINYDIKYRMGDELNGND